MAQANVYFYVVVDEGAGENNVVAGSRNTPYAVSLTGPSVYTKRFEAVDTSTTPATLLTLGASGNLAAASLVLIRASVAGVLTWVGTDDSGTYKDTSALGIPANCWQPIFTDDTAEHDDDTGINRALNTVQNITAFYFKANTGTSVDIEVKAYA